MADDRRHPVGARLAGSEWFRQLTGDVGTVLVFDEAGGAGRGRTDLSVRLASRLADVRRTYRISPPDMADPPEDRRISAPWLDVEQREPPG